MTNWLQKNVAMYRKNITLFLIVSVLTFFLFRHTFSTYFFQDDWFSLSISQPKTIGEFFSFFVPRADVIYYRPLGMQVPFFLNQVLFGLNPFPFRVATFTFHLFNGYLLFRILEFFLKEKRLAFFGTLLYLTSSVHLTIFYWAATFAFVLAPTFYFGSFLLFLKGKYWLSLIVFILGIMTNELMMTLPFMISIYLVMEKKFKLRRIVTFFAVSSVYLLFRVWRSFPATASYSRAENLNELLRNLRDYFLWTFNWPEEIHNQFVTFFKLNPLFLKDFGGTVFLFLLSMLVFMVCLWFLPAWQIMWHKQISRFRLGAFGWGWFLVTLLPVLYFGQHRFSYYLPIPLAGLLVGSFSLFQTWSGKQAKKFTTGILVIVGLLWYLAAWKNIEFNTYVHWAPRRAALSRQIVKQMISVYPTLPRGSVVVINGQSDEEESKWALGDQNALRVIYQDPTLTTYFGTGKEYKQQFGDQTVSGQEEKTIVEIL